MAVGENRRDLVRELRELPWSTLVAHIRAGRRGVVPLR